MVNLLPSLRLYQLIQASSMLRKRVTMCTLKKLKLNLWLNLDYAPMTKIKKAEILTWQGKNMQSSISVTHGLKQSRREPSGFSVSQQNGLTFSVSASLVLMGAVSQIRTEPPPPPPQQKFYTITVIIIMMICQVPPPHPHFFFLTTTFDNKHEKKKV